MTRHIPLRLTLIGAIALALYGTASVGLAQTPPPPPPPQQPVPPPAPPPPVQPAQPATTMPAQQQPTVQQGSSGQFYQGTESTATYPIQNGTLTVNAGMPAQVKQYGPPPSFATLDTNNDGRISKDEAQAYPPLDSDFLYASGQQASISRSRYETWVKSQN